MKNFLSLLLITALLTLLYPCNTTANSDDGYFIVTAYYSPLPDQDYYLT